MTLQTFLARTAPTPPATLRRAMTTALLVERPTSAEGFARFYERVVSELDALGRASQSEDDSGSQDGLHIPRGMCPQCAV